MLDVLGIKNANKLVKLPEDQVPEDPVSENANILMMKPVKAFLYQDHPAHIQVHMAAMKDPKIMQLVGQNPQAQVMQAAMMAHIAEHLAFAYRKQIEEQAGVPMPPPGAEMTPDIEMQISRLAAAAAQQLLRKNQSEAQAQQAQQTAQDPIVQMQQQELQIKQEELKLKQQKLMIDSAEKQDRIELEEKRIAAQAEIAGMQVGAKVATDRANLSAKQQEAGLRMGIEVARSQMDYAQRASETPEEQPEGEQ
jgi:hypothetical protein